MPTYTYTAKDDQGKKYTKTDNFSDKQELYQVLHQQGHEFLTVKEKGAAGAWFEKVSEKFETIKQEDKIILARNLGAMIDAGLTLARGLDVLERQTKSKKLTSVLKSIKKSINKGNNFASSLEEFPKIFSPLFISMVRAGEESGNLSESLRTVATQMDASYKLRKKVKGAMMYPSIIFGAMIIIGILMMIFVVPTLTATFIELNVDLPKSTQLIIAISDFLKNQAIIALGGLVLFIAGVTYYIRTAHGKKVFGFIVIKIPVIGELVKEVNSARTASTLSSLLTSGVEMIHALEITEGVLQNVHYKKILRETQETVKKGGVISEVFSKYVKLYPPFVAEMVAVGEETGQLAELLTRVGDFYQDDVTERTKDLSTIIEPILMIVIGGAVGFFAVSMITPMYSLTSGI